MPVAGKLQQVVRKGYTKTVCRWTVEDFVPRVQKRNTLVSENFRFGPGEWCLALRSITGSCVQAAASEVQLRGSYYRCSHPRKERVSWKLSVLDIEDKSASAEGVCGIEVYKHPGRLPLGPLRDLPKGPMKVQCELRIIDEGNTDLSSQIETHPGDPEIVGTLRTKNSWIVPDFPVLAQRGRRLSSRSFDFRSRLWQLHISPKISDVSLSLECASESRAPFLFCWELSVENDWGDVLKRNDDVCQGEEILDVALSLGSLSDVQRFVESEGALRVHCELRLPDIYHTPPSRVETEAGTDILVGDFQRLQENPATPPSG